MIGSTLLWLLLLSKLSIRDDSKKADHEALGAAGHDHSALGSFGMHLPHWFPGRVVESDEGSVWHGHNHRSRNYSGMHGSL